jgi:hypothetical protein
MLDTDIIQMSARQQEEEVKTHIFLFPGSEDQRDKTDQLNPDNYEMPPDNTDKYNVAYESQLLPSEQKRDQIYKKA